MSEAATVSAMPEDHLSICTPVPSGWECHLFGSKPSGTGLVYSPSKGAVPNRFIRWMMKICLGCTWVKTEEADNG